MHFVLCLCAIKKCLNFAVLKVLLQVIDVLSAVSVEVHRTLFGVDLVAEQRLVCMEVHEIDPL